MADKIVQLTDADGNNIFPVSANPDDVAIIETTATDPGEGVPLEENHFIGVYGTPQVETAGIADKAVTSDKIDFTAIPTVVGTVTGTTPNYVLKYPDGTMIAVIRKTATVNITSQLGSLYQTTYNGSNLVFAESFAYAPAVQALAYSSQTVFVAADTGGSTSHAPNIVLCRGTSASNVNVNIDIIAVGRWKA